MDLRLDLGASSLADFLVLALALSKRLDIDSMRLRLGILVHSLVSQAESKVVVFDDGVL